MTHETPLSAARAKGLGSVVAALEAAVSVRAQAGGVGRRPG